LMQTDTPVAGEHGAGSIDVHRALHAPLGRGNVNHGLTPNFLILALNRVGTDLAKWSRSSWSAAGGALAAGGARSSWSCHGCASGSSAIDPARSSWSRSSWSSAGEDASAEVAAYETALAEAAQDD